MTHLNKHYFEESFLDQGRSFWACPHVCVYIHIYNIRAAEKVLRLTHFQKSEKTSELLSMKYEAWAHTVLRFSNETSQLICFSWIKSFKQNYIPFNSFHTKFFTPKNKMHFLGKKENTHILPTNKRRLFISKCFVLHY